MKPSVATLAATDRQLREILDELGIDYACAGSMSLEDAATAAGLSLNTVLQRLGREPCTEPPKGAWVEASLSRLVAHLCSEHTQLRYGVARTTAAAFETASHASPDDRTIQNARAHFGGLVDALRRHFRTEEHLLFPIVESMEDAWCGGAEMPPRLENGLKPILGRLMNDHQTIEKVLHELRSCRLILAANDRSACRDLAMQLRVLECRVHDAMNLEHVVLFPRAMALEDDLYGVAAGPPT